MAYSIVLLPFDFGVFFSPPPPSVVGRFSAASGAMIETAMGATGPGGLTLSFASAATPPTGSSTLLVSDVSGPGDVFRSGVLTAWPPSPATLTVVSVPVMTTAGVPLTRFSAARIAALVAPLVGTPVPIPGWIIATMGTLTAGTFIPTGLTIGGITVTTSAPNLITATITGTFAFTKLYFFPSTSIFTATVTLAVAPSGDAANKAHIFAISVVGSSFDPGFITPSISLALWMFAPLVAQVASGAIDGALNGAILSMVGTSLGGSASPVGAVTLSPTASICARRIIVLPGGVTVQMLVSDLLGPAIILPAPPLGPTPPLGTMRVSVTPTPVDDISNTYTVTVVNQATGSPIIGAAVKIETAGPTGASQTLSRTTNQSGIATFINTTLRFIDAPRGPRGHVDPDGVAPSLSVSFTGFTPVKQDLL